MGVEVYGAMAKGLIRHSLPNRKDECERSALPKVLDSGEILGGQGLHASNALTDQVVSHAPIEAPTWSNQSIKLRQTSFINNPQDDI